MRKPMGTKWVGRVLGLCLVGGATAVMAQVPGYDATSAQDSRLTGTSDGSTTGLSEGMLSPTGTSSASQWDQMTPAQQQQQLMSVQQPTTNMTPSMSGVQPSQTMDYSSMSSAAPMADSSSMMNSSSMGSQMSVAEVVAQKEYEIAQLRTQVAQLQQQLLQSQSAMQQMGAQNQGVGGSGTGGSGTGGSGSSDVGNPSAEAPAGATGLGYTSGTGQGGSGTAQNSAPAIAEATVLQTGRVRSVDARQLILEDDAGAPFTVPLAEGVRVFKGQQQMGLSKLTPGKWVRTSADLYTPGKPVTRIDVLPKKP